ncbi:MAG: lasso RiPP family leader peptide-containing protein [Rhodobacteraceae bacterium]|jgi:hypothetical protein|nr:lasso RiPP family leader peptide-containing protein [Paracoccaceae bacterium]
MSQTTPTYAAPVLTVHGKLEDLTRGASKGNALDAVFPIGTPVSDLTFS